MAKIEFIVAFMAIFSSVLSSLLSPEGGTELFGKAILAPEGSFATPPNPGAPEVLSHNPDDVSFLLFSSASDPAKYSEIIYKDVNSLGNLSAEKPVKFLIHGYLQNGTTNFPRVVKDAYLSTYGEAYDIIVVDWGKLATPNIELPAALALYASAVQNVKIAGVRTGEFIAWLDEQDKLDLEKTHVIGHSLGAHVAGYAGETVENLTGRKVARMSALDPAGPLFETSLAARTMRKSDAQYVDSYHTGKGGLGIVYDTGNSDFWINNGGPIQPGCLPDIGGFCSHWRSFEFWRQSIVNSTSRAGSFRCACTSNSLLKRLRNNCCEEKVNFGESVTPETKGTYYLNF